MSFIIWYKITFIDQSASGGGGILAQVPLPFIGPSFPLTVSNDVFRGKYILDANIKVTMTSGETVDSFTIVLLNLPADVAAALNQKQEAGLKNDKPLLADIYLGYFDEPTASASKPVMKGVVTSVNSKVNDQGLLETTISGQEVAGYKLRTSINPFHGQDITVSDLIAQVAEHAGIAPPHGSSTILQQKVRKFTSPMTNGLEVLRTLTTKYEFPLLIRDGQLFVGTEVGKEKNTISLDPDSNLIDLQKDQITEEADKRCKKPDTPKTEAKTRKRLRLQALGHPTFRLGQILQVVVDDKDLPASASWRITELTHQFTTYGSQGGYTCQIIVTDAQPGEYIVRKMTGAQGVVQRIRDVAENVQIQKQIIDVGEVSAYTPGSKQEHTATLKYGQSPCPDTVTPSVDTLVNDKPELHDTTMLSPFAWHKCGLIVPVYPGMRALLAHNLGLTTDAIVTGFLWSDNPTYDRPENQEGDYWLCLPTEFGTDEKGLPKGKGVNDLTDKSGLRIIEAKGLRIFVGDNDLSDVGKRPTTPDTQTVVIEHQSKTKIAIDSGGAVTIQTSQKDITLTNGTVTLKLGSNGVEIS